MRNGRRGFANNPRVLRLGAALPGGGPLSFFRRIMIDSDTIKNAVRSSFEPGLKEARALAQTITHISEIADKNTPLEFISKYPYLLAIYPDIVCNEYLLHAHWCIRETPNLNAGRGNGTPPPGFCYGLALMLSLLPPLYGDDKTHIWLYRGMSKAEAAQIARGDYNDISHYWTTILNKAAGYARGGGVVCAIFVPRSCIRGATPEIRECYIPAFEALSNAAQIRFYRPIRLASTFLNKCCNLLIFKQIKRILFGRFQAFVYLRLTNQKVSSYEIQQ